MKHTIRTVGLLALTLLAAPLVAQDPSAMTHEQMMEAWMATAQPGAQHQQLAAQAGNWNYTNKWWQDPAGEPEVSQGTSSGEMIFDGRILQEHFHGTMMGGPFEGMGLTGYDNNTGKWWNVWFDNMGTGVYPSEGSYDEATGKMTMEGAWPGPGGMTMKVKMVGWSEADGSRKFEMSEERAGEWVRTMEITYTRQ
jgi:hypothetical protein